MPLTPETLTRHELVGLHVRVVESTDSSRVGVEGRVVSETMRTLLISDGSGVTRVPKRGTTFEFRLTDEPAVFRRTQSDDVSATRRHSAKEAGTASEPVSDESHTAGYDAAYVTVDGVELLSRPALRSEQGVDSKWR